MVGTHLGSLIEGWRLYRVRIALTQITFVFIERASRRAVTIGSWKALPRRGGRGGEGKSGKVNSMRIRFTDRAQCLDDFLPRPGCRKSRRARKHRGRGDRESHFRGKRAVLKITWRNFCRYKASMKRGCLAAALLASRTLSPWI